MGSKGTSCMGSSLWEELGRENKFDQTVVGSSQQTKKCENLKIFFFFFFGKVCMLLAMESSSGTCF